MLSIFIECFNILRVIAQLAEMMIVESRHVKSLLKKRKVKSQLHRSRRAIDSSLTLYIEIVSR